MLCSVSLTKQTPECLWVTFTVVLRLGIPSWTIWDWEKPSFVVKILSTLAGHTRASVTTESQIALNNFKMCTKWDASALSIFMNDLYYDIFQRSFITTIKAQALYDVADPDFEPDDGDQYDKQLFNEKQSFVFCVWLLPSDRQRKRIGQAV